MNTIQQYTETFNDFTNREQMLDYLIFLGESLPAMSKEHINKKTHVRGCQNNIWITCQKDNDACYYSFHSDSKVVRGICKVFQDVYTGKSAEQITDINYYDFKDIAANMTHERQRGMQAIINRIHKLAIS